MTSPVDWITFTQTLPGRVDALEAQAPVPGPPGRDGLDGAPGRDGIDGAPGLPGRDGIDGAPGLPGEQGIPGQNGLQGIPGLTGLTGLTGAQGLTGPQGLQGPPGTPADPAALTALTNRVAWLEAVAAVQQTHLLAIDTHLAAIDAQLNPPPPPPPNVLTQNVGESFAAFVSRLPANTEGALLPGTYDIGAFGGYKAGQTIRPVQKTSGLYETVTLRGTHSTGVSGLTLHDLFIVGTANSSNSKVFELNSTTNFTVDHCDITTDPQYILSPGEGILWNGNQTGMKITSNKIHHIGAHGGFDHGIYGAGTTSGGSICQGNWIYANAAFGMQLYPNCTNLDCSYNVVDGNGALADCTSSAGPPVCPPSTTNGRGIILYNSATGNTIRNSIVSIFGGTASGYAAVYSNVGGNTLKDSLLYQAGGGATTIGITGTNIIGGDPMFVDRANRDYRLKPGSPAMTLMGAYAQAVPGPRV